MALIQDSSLGCHLLDSFLVTCCVGICDCEGIRCFGVSAVALQWKGHAWLALALGLQELELLFFARQFLAQSLDFFCLLEL